MSETSNERAAATPRVVRPASAAMPSAKQATSTPAPQASSPETPRKRRPRTGRKRSVFHKAPRPAWPVRGLWESAPKEEKERAHTTCMAILAYWLGKKSKSEVAAELEITVLRVWQLSQQALSGMMAGLLKQPRRRVGPEAFERKTGENPSELKQRIVQLEKDLSRTEDLVRVLRMAPWQSASADTPPKGGVTRGRNTKASRGKARPKTRPRTRRTNAAGAETPAEDAGGAG